MDRRKAVIILALGCSLFGFLGVCSRYFYVQGLNSFEVSFVRQGLATAGLFVLILLTNRKALRIGREDILFVVAFGVLRLLSDASLFYSQNYSPLALSSLLQMTFPYYVLILSLFIFHERITAKKLIAIFIAFLGCVLMTGGLVDSEDESVRGVLSALFSGLCFGLYLIGNSVYVGKGKDPSAYVFYCFLVSSVVCLPFVDLGKTVTAMWSLEGIEYTLTFSLALTLLPMSLLAWSAKFIEATTVSVVTMVKIVTAAIAGYMFYQEALSPVNIFGMGLLMISVVILNVRVKKEADELEKTLNADGSDQMESKT